MTHSFNFDKGSIRLVVSHHGKQYKKATGLTTEAALWDKKVKSLRAKCKDQRIWNKLRAIDLRATEKEDTAETEEDRQALEVFRGLKRFTVVDFSDAPEHVRESFLRKVNRILDHGEMLMEAKSDGETIRIFGGSTKDETLLEDITILAGDALICIRGTIRTDQIEELMRQTNL